MKKNFFFNNPKKKKSPQNKQDIIIDCFFLNTQSFGVCSLLFLKCFLLKEKRIKLFWNSDLSYYCWEINKRRFSNYYTVVCLRKAVVIATILQKFPRITLVLTTFVYIVEDYLYEEYCWGKLDSNVLTKFLTVFILVYAQKMWSSFSDLQRISSVCSAKNVNTLVTVSDTR